MNLLELNSYIFILPTYDFLFEFLFETIMTKGLKVFFLWTLYDNGTIRFMSFKWNHLSSKNFCSRYIYFYIRM